MTDRQITKAKMCWHCAHGRFERRSTKGAVRYSGTCMQGVKGEGDIPESYRPPKAFYADLRDGTFCTTYDEFVEKNATIYWPHRIAMDKSTKSPNVRYMPEARLAEEFRCMLWLHDNDNQIDSVSWSDVCDAYERCAE